MWIGLADERRERGALAQMPRRLQPAPLNLTVKPLVADAVPFRRDEVLLELLDFDVY